LTNIDKKYLNSVKDENYSKFYIGVSDIGDITGIPIHKSQLDDIKLLLEEKLVYYYKDLIGLHKNKGDKKVLIDDCIYYDFKKIVEIIKKHTKIKIHKLDKNCITNDEYIKMNEMIEEVLKEQKIYLLEKNLYKNKKKLKKEYNEKYSQAFHNLINSDTMYEFKLYLKGIDFPFDDVLKILRLNIKSADTVETYVKNGFYVEKSLFPEDEVKDKYYGEKVNKFLEYYKEFKDMMLNKNIKIEPFILKDPIRKLNAVLKNITCFSEQFYKNNDIIYIMIEINLPIIKDNKVYLGLKDKGNIKIIKRTYEYNMNMPCTFS
tara:strand:- start:85 stop:1038 length:954 start_codon:yes stop_codon:yes gene_type:complete